MSGGTNGAESGTLTVMVGGDPQLFDRAAPVLSAFGSRIVRMGPVGSGHAMKAVNNALLAVNILAVGEGLAALVKAGVPARTALNVLNASSGRSFVSETLVPERVLTGAFPKTFKLTLLQKDAGIAAGLLRDTGVSGPVIDLAYPALRRGAGHAGRRRRLPRGHQGHRGSRRAWRSAGFRRLPVPVHLVLIAPQDIVNVASAVRICRNFGITSMRVVAPEVELDAYRIEGVAHNTAEFISRIEVYDTLEPALADCVQAMVLTGRERAAKRRVIRPREAASELLDWGKSGPVAIVAGREDHGLTNEELDACHTLVTISTDPTLHLAQPGAGHRGDVLRAVDRRGRRQGAVQEAAPRREARDAGRAGTDVQ